MIILTNLQATATCKHKVLGVHTSLCKYQTYHTMEFGIWRLKTKYEVEGNDKTVKNFCFLFFIILKLLSSCPKSAIAITIIARTAVVDAPCSCFRMLPPMRWLMPPSCMQRPLECHYCFIFFCGCQITLATTAALPTCCTTAIAHNITMLCNAHPVVAVVVFEPTVLLLLPSTRLIVAK